MFKVMSKMCTYTTTHAKKLYLYPQVFYSFFHAIFLSFSWLIRTKNELIKLFWNLTVYLGSLKFRISMNSKFNLKIYFFTFLQILIPRAFVWVFYFKRVERSWLRCKKTSLPQEWEKIFKNEKQTEKITDKTRLFY